MKPISEKVKRGRIKDGFFGSDDSLGNYGLFILSYPDSRDRLLVISDPGEIEEQHEWEHVSVSVYKKNRCPTWEQMCFVKDLFWSEEETVLQFHPPKSEYIDDQQYTLHLWKPKKKVIPRPPSNLVGYRRKK